MGKRQRLLKRIKMDNVDCDGRLGEDAHLKNVEPHTRIHTENVLSRFCDMKCEMVIKRKHLFIFSSSSIRSFYIFGPCTLTTCTSDISWQTYCLAIISCLHRKNPSRIYVGEYLIMLLCCCPAAFAGVFSGNPC